MMGMIFSLYKTLQCIASSSPGFLFNALISQTLCKSPNSFSFSANFWQNQNPSLNKTLDLLKLWGRIWESWDCWVSFALAGGGILNWLLLVLYNWLYREVGSNPNRLFTSQTQVHTSVVG